ncbi:MAG: LacI family DNA-binding transcriptional regulator [Crocinitomicaceae bacterium]
MGKRTTLKDLAKELNTSVTTVSKALKDYPDISDKMKIAVRELAEKMNYQPDLRALALRKSKSYTIGVIIPEIVSYFFSNVVDGIMNYAEKHGYRIVITISNNKLSLEKKHVNLLYNAKVDGVIVSLANETDDPDHFNILTEHEIPIVMFDKVNNAFNCNKVKIDDHQSAYLATEHLIKKGCKHIAHIRGPEHPQNARARFEGYLSALRDNNIPYEPVLVKECKDVTLEEGYTFTKELFSGDNLKPDGIFAVTDQVGVGAVQAAHDLGISIPDDLKIVGFSDSQIAQIITPKLSTIHQPNYKLGETAVQILLNEIAIREKGLGVVDYQKIILSTHLVEREST